ncbi:MAG: hypothetical protein NC238_02050 [Dehalobacter sp.]|nr:hypothetical protein [Dehalobacter sp.]
MKKLLVLSLSVCLLFACSPNSEQIQKAIEQTQSAIPTSTNTKLPTNTSTISPTQTLTPLPTPTSTVTPTDFQIDDIFLDEILIQYGDLPAGLTGGHISYEAPEMFNELPLADYTIFQQFAKATEVSGGVTVFVYTSLEKIEEAYAKTVEGLGDSTKIVEDIGEKGVISYVSMTVLGSKVEFGDLVFTRCNAVVHVRMTDISDETSLSFYATRLDNRLVESLCP